MSGDALTEEELQQWEAFGLDPNDAQAWVDLSNECYIDADGQPLRTRPGGETDVERAMSYAYSWVDAMGPSIAGAAPWCREFSTNGSYSAAAFRCDGWGAGDARRSIAEAAAFDSMDVPPAEANSWIEASFDSDSANPFIYAGVSVEEAQAMPDADEASLRAVGALRRRL